MIWQIVNLSQVSKVASGFGFPREYQGYIDKEIPFFKVDDMNLPENSKEMRRYRNTISRKIAKKLKLRTFPAGTVIFPKIGAAIATGKKRILVQESTFDNNIMGLIPTEIIESSFLYYWLLTINLINISNKGPVPSIRKTTIENINLQLPTRSEQKRIVEILDQADALRKKRIEADKIAERIIPALFYNMFGDPVKDWKNIDKIQIKSLIQKVYRRNPNDNPNKIFNYIDISGIDGNKGEITTFKTLLGSEAPGRARQIIKQNDVLISTVRPYLRATALVPEILDNQICSTGFCVLRSKQNYGFGYLYALTRIKWFTQVLNMKARGASYPAVTDKDIYNVEILFPKDKLKLLAFDKNVVDVLSLQKKRNNSLRMIDDLFSQLLEKAFSGELTAKWREAHMQELLREMEVQSRYLNEAKI